MLLYGYPGTGKTQFCLQMAKEHDMPVMEVNVAQIQSKWVGDSEKNARKIFRQYEKLCKQAKREGMLLFNEADALFSKRIEVVQSVDSMNNAMKNIFLEEMENFQGFLMATTNLSGNLDAAFERRFLFKVGFDRPSETITAKIWQQYFKGLSGVEALRLAKKYPFSPGEISNVRRKYIIEKALGSSKSRVAMIEDIAQFEKIETQRVAGVKAVGFG
ncbi:MAG: ATP-binding protein [Bacteroidia bacterium]|nr:ATP-binding protein [Bacteroidia bacterium]